MCCKYVDHTLLSNVPTLLAEHSGEGLNLQFLHFRQLTPFFINPDKCK
jgi:hypothetical protein